ncbi:hypothetical protein TanjilG_17585 [Lupinus angustifolius]|uniref:cytokinin dehydrogenase n=1 Tax=Lupinus angustifolius TaxID=3871 RepID=A0A1J7GSY8_LUPAN|nr:PREDICTED: cytokinin dehydrogenase 3-like [Lupinus angustifolius]OIV97401.1 hypothetical protein TanjilG_17585 [Lupinus angustifolius]
MASKKHPHPWSPLEAPKDLAQKLSLDPETLSLASSDFGLIEHKTPLAVFEPSYVSDIVNLIKYSNSLPIPFTIAPKGKGHSTHGQAMTNDGVVVNMTRLSDFRNGSGIIVYDEYVDVGAEQLWIDVLHETLKHGLTPLSWTDYLYLTVGGTLSNAGITGTTFKFGPQISNVLELDVVTGKGDLVTCSPDNNSELFYSVLGGLGQFGIITRARIVLGPAPTRVKWVQLLYSDFSAFIEDQEHLISFHERNETKGADHIAGCILVNHSRLNLSFYPPNHHQRITSLVTEYGIIYSLELVKYYDNNSQELVNEEVQNLLKVLKFIPSFSFEKDVSYEEFLNRLHESELVLKPKGLWNVPHPWMDLFVPKSRITDFNEGVLKGIILKENIYVRFLVFYPMNQSKWDDRMSSVIPDEHIFYALAFFRATGFDKVEVESSEAQNQHILEFCKDNGIKSKVYLASYKTQEEWVEHYGSKWKIIEKRKAEFDPKRILSPGQRIFN